MSDRYPRVRLAEDGELVVREVLAFSYYVHRPHAEIASQVMHSLNTFIARTGALLREWSGYDEHHGEWIEMDAAGLARLRDDLAREAVSCHILSDQSWTENRYGFSYRGARLEEPWSALRFYLPSEEIEQRGPAHMRELALELLGALPVCSGNVGLALNLAPVSGARQVMYEHCYRYPGFDLASPTEADSAQGARVAGPSWLTFLGRPFLDQIGGVSGLRSRLKSPDTTVQGLDGERVVVTLGDWPEAGDMEKGRRLPAYRELAAVLEPCLFRRPEGFRGFFNNYDDLRRWERRFLD
jgi:hypothetical protein